MGSSGTQQKGWVPADIEYLNLLVASDWKSFFSESPVTAILAEHVWEHLTEEEGLVAARTCYRYLSSEGGYIRAAVPDGMHPDPAFIEWIRPGGSGPVGEEHQVLYNYRTFVKLFEKAGFTVDLLEYFDENGEFHFREWNPEDGLIRRSLRFDSRNAGGQPRYTSVILDARKVGSAK